MKLCYLVNQYPKVSHSFIRREILELENQGAVVQRIALRGWEQPVVDPEDLAEQGRTRYILKAGALRLLHSVLGEMARHPRQFFLAFAGTLVLIRGSDKSAFKYMICFIEACMAAKWVRAGNAAHIHAHFGTNSADVALLTSRLTGIPFSFTVHGPEEFDHPQGLRLGEKMRHASFVVAISSFGRSQLFRWADAALWHRIVVVRCGLDLGFFTARSAAVRRSGTFVCVGRLSEQKGQLLLLEALRLVLDRGHECQLVLAGDGELRQQIEQRARTLAVQDRVSITGWISAGQVKQEIQSARALVLPSFAEGLPVVLMESLALAAPVITTYVAGIPELVKDGKNGWLVPAGDAQALAQAMIDCLGCSEDQLRTMGEDGLRLVREQHDIRREAARLLALFGKGPA